MKVNNSERFMFIWFKCKKCKFKSLNILFFILIFHQTHFIWDSTSKWIIYNDRNYWRNSLFFSLSLIPNQLLLICIYIYLIQLPWHSGTNVNRSRPLWSDPVLISSTYWSLFHRSACVTLAFLILKRHNMLLRTCNNGYAHHVYLDFTVNAV